MSADEFTKLFRYMQKEFKKIDFRFDEQKADFNKLSNAVDTYAKKVDDYTQEMLMLAHKVDRLEQWILKVAEATGVKLAA